MISLIFPRLNNYIDNNYCIIINTSSELLHVFEVWDVNEKGKLYLVNETTQ